MEVTPQMSNKSGCESWVVFKSQESRQPLEATVSLDNTKSGSLSQWVICFAFSSYGCTQPHFHYSDYKTPFKGSRCFIFPLLWITLLWFIVIWWYRNRGAPECLLLFMFLSSYVYWIYFVSLFTERVVIFQTAWGRQNSFISSNHSGLFDVMEQDMSLMKNKWWRSQEEARKQAAIGKSHL